MLYLYHQRKGNKKKKGDKKMFKVVQITKDGEFLYAIVAFREEAERIIKEEIEYYGRRGRIERFA